MHFRVRCHFRVHVSEGHFLTCSFSVFASVPAFIFPFIFVYFSLSFYLFLYFFLPFLIAVPQSDTILCQTSGASMSSPIVIVLDRLFDSASPFK